MRGDINLLPKRSTKDGTKIATGFIVAVIAVSLVSAVFLVYLPTMDKLKLQKEVADKDAELSTYTATQEEYNTLSAELNLLKNRVNAFENINITNLSKLTLMADVEAAMPTDTVLNSFSFSPSTLSISGTTSTNQPDLVSQLMVNLRNIENVSNVTLGSFTSTDIGYFFSLTVTYDLEVPEEIIEEVETTEEGAE